MKSFNAMINGSPFRIHVDEQIHIDLDADSLTVIRSDRKPAKVIPIRKVFAQARTKVVSINPQKAPIEYLDV